jgi:protocatechuate 4,5-dioxygenase alpha chain
MRTITYHQPIPGGTIFDGRQTRKGHALNKMCFSFNDAGNRAAFLRDEDSYCARYGLNAQQREAIRNRNMRQLIAAGGNTYYLAIFARIFALDLPDASARPIGLIKDQFPANQLAASRG